MEKDSRRKIFMMEKPTIVTAFFDIGRSEWPFYQRPNRFYLDCFARMAKINNDMVIYTEEKFKDFIVAARKQNPYKTTVVLNNPIDKDESCKKQIGIIKQIMDSDKFKENIKDYSSPEYWSPLYVVVTNLKSRFVYNSFKNNIIDTKLAAWIDFGYVRSDNYLPENLEWKFPYNDDKIHMFNLIPIDVEHNIEDVVKTNTVYIQGCHIVADRQGWDHLDAAVTRNLKKLFDLNLVDDDQTLFLMSYLENPEKYQLHYVDETQNGWFIIFKNFNVL